MAICFHCRLFIFSFIYCRFSLLYCHIGHYAITLYWYLLSYLHAYLYIAIIFIITLILAIEMAINTDDTAMIDDINITLIAIDYIHTLIAISRWHLFTLCWCWCAYWYAYIADVPLAIDTLISWLHGHVIIYWCWHDDYFIDIYWWYW